MPAKGAIVNTFPHCDVLVVGNGIIGATIAWRAAESNLKVTILDPTPGMGATQAAAGMLAPISETSFGEEKLTELCLNSYQLWEEFAVKLQNKTGQNLEFYKSGTLLVGFDRDDAALGAQMHKLHLELGLQVEDLTLSEARQKEPFLANRISSAYWIAQDHQVNPRLVYQSLWQILNNHHNISVVPRWAQQITINGGKANGIVLENGETITAERIILAAGAQSSNLLQASGIGELYPQIRSVSGQTIRLRAPKEIQLTHVVRGTVQLRPIYVVPRNPGLVSGQRNDGYEIVVGASSEERHLTQAKAGAVFGLLRDARALIPALDECDFIEVSTGQRPGSPDNLPVIGQGPIENLIISSGHYRNGVLLTPLTAAYFDDYFANGKLPKSLSPQRFQR